MTAGGKPRHREGDVFLFSGRGPVSWGIRLGTWSRYSHAAICAHIDSNDLQRCAAGQRWSVSSSQLEAWEPGVRLIESTTLVGHKCQLLRRAHNGVQCHWPHERLGGYVGRVWRLRMREPLTAAESTALTASLLDAVGAPYDGGGALMAGTTWLKKGLLAPRAADRSTLYCCEVVAAALVDALAGTRRLGEVYPGRMSPKALHRWLVEVSGLWGEPYQLK